MENNQFQGQPNGQVEPQPNQGQYVPAQNPQVQYVQQPQNSPKSNTKWIIILLIVIILILGGVVAYFAMGSEEDEWTELPQPMAQEPVAPAPEPTPAPTPAPAPTPKTNTAPKATTPKATAPAPAPVTTPAVTLDVARFEGNWKGVFSRNVLADKSCSNGDSSLDISSTGAVTGTITTPTGETYYGDGSVDAKGNLKGTWKYGISIVSFSGTLSGTTGTGTYLEAKYGCFGGFNLRKGS